MGYHTIRTAYIYVITAHPNICWLVFGNRFQKSYVKKIAEKYSIYNDKKVRSKKKSNLSHRTVLIWDPLCF